MKIWLNHTLACPDDDFYPLNLRIFTWENTNDQFSSLLEAFRARNLYNYRDTDSPFIITSLQSSSESHIIQKNLDQLGESSGIIRILKEKGKILLYDAVIITPLPLKKYYQMYLNILEEFSFIADLTENTPAIDAFNVVRKITSDFQEKGLIGNIKSNFLQEVEEQLTKSFQELLYLNMYLTYFEIEEGLLVCPHCKRWFPIIKTIPRMYPKSMKREEMDLTFMDKWKHFFPKDILVD